MKRMVILFVVLLIAVLAGVAIEKDPGYVLIAYRQWTIETPLWFALAAVVLSFIFLSFLFRLCRGAGLLSQRFNRWRQRRKIKRSHSNTSRGLIELTEGNWLTAEKYLLKALPSSDTPLINYLAAARAAQQRGESKLRDQYLREAQQSMPDAKVAIELTQAQLQLANGQDEQALATLQHLHSLVPKHAYVLQLLHNIYIKLKDWDKLREIMPKLHRYHVFNRDELHDTQVMMYQGLLAQASKQKDLTALQTIWHEFPRALRKDPDMVARYATLLIEQDAASAAEVELRYCLKKQFDEQLVTLYGLAEGDDPKKQLQVVEGLLKQHPNNPTLLLAAARICLYNQLWGKARSYFENSLNYEARPETYAELAQLVERLGEKQLATEYYRQGLVQLSTRKNTGLPKKSLPKLD